MFRSNSIARVFSQAVLVSLLVASCSSKKKSADSKGTEQCLKEVLEQIRDVQHVDLKNDGLRRNYHIRDDGVVLTFWIDGIFAQMKLGLCEPSSDGYLLEFTSDEKMNTSSKLQQREVLFSGMKNEASKKCDINLCWEK